MILNALMIPIYNATVLIKVIRQRKYEKIIHTQIMASEPGSILHE